MYWNVDAEIKRNGINRGILANLLEISPSTMSMKLNGKSIITLAEAKKIKKVLNTNMPLEDLFYTDKSKIVTGSAYEIR